MIDKIDPQVRDALWSGYIDLEFEMSKVKTLSSITSDKDNIYLAGDRISLVPKFRKVDVQIGKIKITGLTKTELLMHIIRNRESMKIGEYMGWSKYLVQYNTSVIVISINEKMQSSVKLLKDDNMAKDMFESHYQTPINEWRKVETKSPIYGEMAIGIPHVIDDIIERVETALEFLESIEDHEVRAYISRRLEDFTL